jgi:hypothetical protein
MADAPQTPGQTSDKLAQTLFFLVVGGVVAYVAAVFLFAL